MNATTIGLDIAKNVFRVHGIDAEGDVVIRRPTSSHAAWNKQPALAHS